ncbi:MULTISPECIES: cytochrome c biogenesis heme-transporting ATPase CcmA [Pseudoalteromonas]|uniref:Cytochrome c biogenesis heme-transporting ATPase CcmA n=1 Tax=Pseudoalteromonas agarivorans TaxID=176102 RepID=A0AAD0U4Q1_9GAMM|nr:MULTISPECIES: cytochrome c biogenesis heme-transporting ATPase CcmA [Pseudoalteromonas]MAJ39632.1 cytochrome c biogenesis heme-transporting ATPase CcmA [Pseudoalteromonadaceae bacterium]MCP4057173.1 cytochrome c biogenesis heme-transporting ATPase CcmA [Pseudoalteromonas sp.]MDC9521033.1 cytochrome c biogenesis heme-transporting ATPase CcmA [Pseudoalteromonas sp. Angola-31]MDY6887499.1 cytochrome c biogenesis heme-transporting ATPase CcmA [Pseudomonadota bacterium]AYM87254.1 cytochrome c bi
MLHIKSVTCIKQERCLFADLNFSLNSGQIMQLAGPNGAGKTSLLRIVAGFSVPDEGAIFYNQQAITKHYEEYATDLLFIGHKTGVNVQLSALENVRHWLHINGYTNEPDLYPILAKLGLVGLEDVPVRMLSAGQQRRVALVRLWLSDAKLWVLDEPFTALDKNGVAFLQQRFSEHLKSGGAILLTTHQDLTTQFENLQTVTLEYRY